MSRVQSIERAFAVLGALGGRPARRDRGRRPRRSCPSRRPRGCSRHAGPRGRRRAGPRRHALPARAAARDARRAGSCRSARSRPSPGRSLEPSWPPRPARPPAWRVPDGDLAHYIDQVGTPNPVSVRDWTGSRVPLHAVSSGQVLLAFRPPTAVERYLAGRWSASRPGRSSTADARARAAARRPARRLHLGARGVRRGHLVGGGAGRRRVRRGRGRGPRPRAVVPIPGARAGGRAGGARGRGGRPDRGRPAARPARRRSAPSRHATGRCSSISVCASNWARPSTNQIASTGTSPIVARRCGIDELIEIASPGSRTYSSNPMRTWRRPLST